MTGLQLLAYYSAFLALVLCLFATSTNGKDVGLGYDSRCVDTSNPGGEAYNVQGLLLSLGDTVTKITAYDNDAAWASILAGVSVLVFPENEGQPASHLISTTSRDRINGWIQGGGTAVVFNGDTVLLNYLTSGVGFTSGKGSGPWAKTSDGSASALFVGGPASLASLNAAYSVDTSTATVSSGSIKCMYGSASDCALFQYSLGAGLLYGVAPDYYDSKPLGSQDGGWVSALTLIFSTGVVPSPSPSPSNSPSASPSPSNSPSASPSPSPSPSPSSSPSPTQSPSSSPSPSTSPSSSPSPSASPSPSPSCTACSSASGRSSFLAPALSFLLQAW